MSNAGHGLLMGSITFGIPAGPRYEEEPYRIEPYLLNPPPPGQWVLIDPAGKRYEAGKASEIFSTLVDLISQDEPRSDYVERNSSVHAMLETDHEGPTSAPV